MRRPHERRGRYPAGRRARRRSRCVLGPQATGDEESFALEFEEPALAKIPVVVFSARAAGNLPDIAYVNKNDPAALLDLIERQSRPTRLAAR